MKTSHKIQRILAWTLGLVLLDLALTGGWIGLAATIVGSQGLEQGALAILWGDQGQFGAEGERRVRHVARLWYSGDPRRMIFCIGGSRPSRNFYGAEVLCDQLAALGIPRDRLRVGAGSNDTTSNLSEAVTMAKAERLRLIVVATAPMQTLRAKLFIVPHGADPAFAWEPYDYNAVQPEIGLKERLLLAHSELIAAASLLLPETWRRSILNLLRG